MEAVELSDEFQVSYEVFMQKLGVYHKRLNDILEPNPEPSKFLEDKLCEVFEDLRLLRHENFKKEEFNYFFKDHENLAEVIYSYSSAYVSKLINALDKLDATLEKYQQCLKRS